ncbi:MAG: LptF/LptG family permease, partial [Candidatus Acetothermia bacterium]
MVLRKLDRYIIKQLVYPFLFSVVGLIIFVSLSLAIQLSDLLLSRGTSFLGLFYLLGLRLPEFLVFALPIAVLFAIFTVFARLIHDQEILGFQLGGYSIQRIVVPIILFGLMASLLGLAVNCYLAPWANFRYRETLYRIARGEEEFEVQSDVFFKGPEGRTFYVGHYQPESDKLENVLIFDPGGLGITDKENSDDFPQLITSKGAIVRGDKWELKDGYSLRLDEKGQVSHTVAFETMEFAVGRETEDLLLENKQPDEMPPLELRRQIRNAELGGLNVDDLKLALHTKLSLPLAALVFSLFAGPLSLLFRHRSRAVGILLSVVLAGGYQGLLLWIRTLVNQASFDPILGAWLPDLIFGGMGTVLFLALATITTHRLAKWKKNLRNRLPFCFMLAITLALFGILACVNRATATEKEESGLPFRLEAERIEMTREGTEARGGVIISSGEWQIGTDFLSFQSTKEDLYMVEGDREVRFQAPDLSFDADSFSALLRREEDGIVPLNLDLESVRGRTEDVLFSAAEATINLEDGKVEQIILSAEAILEYGDERLNAEEISIFRSQKGWEIHAEHQVDYRRPGTSLQSKDLRINLREQSGKLQAQRLQLMEYEGNLPLRTEEGRVDLFFQADRGYLKFDDQGKFHSAELENVWFTHCSCCGLIEERPYGIRAKELKIRGREAVLAFSVTIKALGRSVGWLPFYFIPLDELQERLYFPRFGYDEQRGLFSNWEVPLRLGEGSYAVAKLGYYHRNRALGLGLQGTVRDGIQEGEFDLYALLRGAGENYYRFVVEDRWVNSELFDFIGKLKYRQGPAPDGKGPENLWETVVSPKSLPALDLLVSREEGTVKEKAVKQKFILHRLPELRYSWKGEPDSFALGEYRFDFSAGHYSETPAENSKMVIGNKLALNSEFESLSWELGPVSGGVEGSGGVDKYLSSRDFGNSGWRYRYGFQPYLTFGKEALALQFAHRFVEGSSPFVFDRKESLDRLSISYRGENKRMKHQLQFSYTFFPAEEAGPSPLTYSLKVDEPSYK